MKRQRELTLLDSKKNRKRIINGFYIFLVALIVVDFFIPAHGHFPWEEVPGFFAVYGFIGCVGLIFIAKGLRWLVRRREDYYD